MARRGLLHTSAGVKTVCRVQTGATLGLWGSNRSRRSECQQISFLTFKADMAIVADLGKIGGAIFIVQVMDFCAFLAAVCARLFFNFASLYQVKSVFANRGFSFFFCAKNMLISPFFI
jgi:hypothetical protein